MSILSGSRLATEKWDPLAHLTRSLFQGLSKGDRRGCAKTKKD